MGRLQWESISYQSFTSLRLEAAKSDIFQDDDVDLQHMLASRAFGVMALIIMWSIAFTNYRPSDVNELNDSDQRTLLYTGLVGFNGCGVQRRS